ncbi:MAG TPA: ChaN family lipoprotein [Chitinophagaceae bacterium]|nr:ChaN family lipoprotein [Chitinophagaceae bacterium]
MFKYILLSLSFASAITASAQKFTVYTAADMKPISIDAAALSLSTANVVFFGEQHNDSLTHVAEYELLQALYKIRQQELVLSLEMFETDCQTVLNEYLAGFINEDKLKTDGRAWNNYTDYRPMVEFAKLNRLPVIAANAPRRYVNLVSRRGMASLDSLSKEAKGWLPPLPYDTLAGAYHEKFMSLMGGHGSSNIYYSQSLWDASMSYSIYHFLKGKKNKRKLVYHVCGSFHSDGKLGTAAQLVKRKSSLVIKNITALPSDMYEKMTKEELAAIADFIIVTTP